MSYRNVIIAARAVIKDEDQVQGGYLVDADEFLALKAALEAYDARWAEFRKIPITGGG